MTNTERRVEIRAEYLGGTIIFRKRNPTIYSFFPYVWFYAEPLSDDRPLTVKIRFERRIARLAFSRNITFVFFDNMEYTEIDPVETFGTEFYAVVPKVLYSSLSDAYKLFEDYPEADRRELKRRLLVNVSTWVAQHVLDGLFNSFEGK